MVTVSPFIIRELTGEKRVVQLAGRGLPYKPFTLRGTQRVKKTWLPGAPNATTTVLGATETMTTIRGFWKSIFIGRTDGASPAFQVNGAPILTARAAVTVIDDIRLQGQDIEVQWLDQLRHGILETFEVNWHTSEDVEWSIDFTWTGRGEADEPPVFITDTDMSDAFSSLQQQFFTLDNITIPTDFGLTTDFLRQIQNFQNGIQTLIFQVEDTLINFTNRAFSTVRALRGTLSTLTSIESEAQLMIDFLASQPAALMNNATPPNEQKPADTLAAQIMQDELRAWAAEMQRTSVEQRVNMQSQVTNIITASYIARDGEDLRDVALRFYQNAFEWRRLQTFNDLNTTELKAGQTVLIPQLNAVDDGANT